MPTHFYVIIGIITSALAQTLLKIASLNVANRIHWAGFILLSICCYGGSFLLYYLCLKYYPISKLSPIMTVSVMLLVILFGAFINEKLFLKQYIGITLGAASIFLLASK